MNDFRNLLVYKKSIDLADQIYTITKVFPDDEKFGLTSQMRRCAISVSSNIAEGAGRSSKKDFGHFLSISLGSCYELETQLTLARRFKYVIDDNWVSVSKQILEVQKMIYSLRKSLLS